jgi:hypothetical protein
MDWATSDYTRTYADTFFLPEPGHDAGVYLLDEASRDTDPEDRVRVPIRRYGDVAGRFGRPIRCKAGSTPYNRARARGELREGFYGNILSSHRNNHAIFDSTWDERPMHYNPSAGSDWAHLVPPPRLRPYGGGPAPSLAFPIISQSEALNRPKDLFQGGETAADQSCKCPSPDRLLQLIKIVLLIVIVVLLAMTLISAQRLSRDLEKTIHEASEILRAATK